MAKYVTKRNATDLMLIIIGNFLMAFAIVLFWQPHGMVTGGVSGLSIIVAHYSGEMGFPIPIWLTTLVLNIPLFILGFRTFSKEEFVRTLFSAGFLSVALFIIAFMPIPESDWVLASIFGGVLCGVGIGLIFRAMATTGGTTLLGAIIHKSLLKHISVAKIIFGIETIIILIGLFVFGHVAAMYAVISIFIATKVTDAILEGMSFAKAAFIISKESEQIAQTILHEMNRGCTALSATGMYTKKEQPMLFCITSMKEIVKLKQIVHQYDENAFVIVADVREVLGEGFAEIKNKI